MPPRKRDEPKKPAGVSKIFSSGGKAGRSPGMGTRNHTGTKPGDGADRPTQGYGLAGSRRKPPDNMKPKTIPKPEDQEE